MSCEISNKVCILVCLDVGLLFGGVGIVGKGVWRRY